jgi:hypothetical protein
MANETNTATETQDVQQVSNDNFSNAMWGKAMSAEQKTTPTQDDVSASTTETKSTEQTITQPDYNSFVKETFGYDSVEAAKENFRTLKEKAEQEQAIKFANKESETIFNGLKNGEGYEDALYNHIKTKKELANLESKAPEDRLKLAIKYEHPDYTDSEVKDLFDEMYNVPEKPEFDETLETEAQYTKKVSQWEKQVELTKRKIERDGKDALAQLKQIQNELILPEIKKAPSEEEKQNELQFQKDRESYLNDLNSNYKSFNGFKVTAYKNNDVEIQVPYNLTEQEKESLKNEISDIDAETYLENRWIANDGKFKVHQIMADKYKLDNFDKILQKVANDTWGKAVDFYQNTVKNIDVNGNRVSPVSQPPKEKSYSQTMAEAVWGRNR